MAKIRSRDHSALGYLYDHYSSAIYGVVFRIVNDKAIAEEVLQDFFLKVWNHIEQYDATRGRLFTWMANIARNLAIDKMRSKEISRNNKTDRLDNLVNTVDEQQSVSQRTDLIGLSDSLKGLPDDQKFVIEYLYFKGYSQSELAKDFNIPLGTIKTRLRSALQKLKNSFS